MSSRSSSPSPSSSSPSRSSSSGDERALVVIAGVIIAPFLWWMYSSASTALRRIRAVPSVKISDLRQVLSDSGDEVLVIVRGRVKPKFGHALRIEGSGEPAVVTRTTKKVTCQELSEAVVPLCSLPNPSLDSFESIASSLGLVMRSWSEQLSSKFKSIPFVLIEQGNQPINAFVDINLENSSHSLPLKLVHYEKHSIPMTTLMLSQAIMGHGYPVELVDKQEALKVGKEISALGFCRVKDGHVEIKACKKLPYFLTSKTKDEIVAELHSETKVFLWTGIILGTLFIFLAY